MHSAQEKCWKWLLAQKILALHKKFAVRSGIREGVEPMQPVGYSHLLQEPAADCRADPVCRH
jgi:hypothetical protein